MVPLGCGLRLELCGAHPHRARGDAAEGRAGTAVGAHGDARRGLQGLRVRAHGDARRGARGLRVGACGDTGRVGGRRGGLSPSVFPGH